MATEWQVVAVLANLALSKTVGCSAIALVPQSDPRVQAECKLHPKLSEFLSKFTDEFGEKISPPVVIISEQLHNGKISSEAIAGFRDAIALSVIPRSRSRQLLGSPALCPSYSDAFAIYPWSLDFEFKGLVTNTPAVLRPHGVEPFQGQSAPALGPNSVTDSNIDTPLRDTLLDRWQTRFLHNNPQWEDLALFRSLNMANQACLMPAGPEMTTYDVGRSIALWVSAFEILAHPGANGKSNKNVVCELLGRTPWLTNSRESKPKTERACEIYKRIDNARNKFLHGNEITDETLSFRGTDHNLFRLAAPLYRMALTSFLSLQFQAPAPSKDDTTALGIEMSDSVEFKSNQKIYEKALFPDPDNGSP